jgi:peptide/nickel transport system permease protein
VEPAVDPAASPAAGISLWQDALRRLRRERLAVVVFSVILLYVVVALAAKFGLAFTGYDQGDPELSNRPPSWEHVCGTNIHGQDILARIAQGARIAMSLGFLVALVAVVVGGIVGSVAGWFGKWVDDLVVWLYSTVASVPDIMLMMAIAALLGRGFQAMFIAMGLTYWVGVARVVRGEFMKLRERDYVTAARALGMSNARIMFAHVAPNAAHMLIVMFSLLFVEAIKAEVVLSFIGVGIVSEPSWGIQIQDAGTELMKGQWWQMAFTSLALFGLVLALQVFTDTLRDALDPRLRH